MGEQKKELKMKELKMNNLPNLNNSFYKEDLGLFSSLFLLLGFG